MPKMDDILPILRNKYKQMDYLMAYTKEMEKAVLINDADGLGTVLNMRQETMERINLLNADVSAVLAGMDQKEQDTARQLLNTEGEPPAFDSQLESDIYNTNRMTLGLLQKIVDLDKDINSKVNKEGG